jgi:hypothetical protein
VREDPVGHLRALLSTRLVAEAEMHAVVVDAITTVPGCASVCRRAAGLGVSPTTSRSCASPDPRNCGFSPAVRRTPPVTEPRNRVVQILARRIARSADDQTIAMRSRALELSREGARCPRVVVLVHADFSAGANATDKSDLESLRRAGTDGSNPASSGAALLQTGRKPGVGSLAFRDQVWRGSASYATQKAADSSPGRSAPGPSMEITKN